MFFTIIFLLLFFASIAFITIILTELIQIGYQSYNIKNQSEGSLEKFIDEITPIEKVDFEKLTKSELYISDEKIIQNDLSKVQKLVTNLIFGESEVVSIVEALKEKREVLESLGYNSNKMDSFFSKEYINENDIYSTFGFLLDLNDIETEIKRNYDAGRFPFPNKIRFVDMAMRMDGGSKIYVYEDMDTKNTLEIMLGQYSSFSRNITCLAGGLYYNNLLIPVRSNIEQDIISKMKQESGLDQVEGLRGLNFSIGGNYILFRNQKNYYPSPLIRKRYIYETTAFVESDDYVELAKALGRI